MQEIPQDYMQQLGIENNLIWCAIPIKQATLTCM